MAQFQRKDSWHHYHTLLFQDPEFIEEANQLKIYLAAKYPNIISVGVYSDELLQSMEVEDADISKIHALASEYLTDADILSNYLSGFYINGRINPKMVATSMTDDGLIQVQFSPDIDRKEYHAAWKRIKEMKPDQTSLVRGPDNWPLLYAIHKARRHGDTFRQIFALFEAGDLYGYKGRTTQHKSEDELEKYFRLYAFTP